MTGSGLQSRIPWGYLGQFASRTRAWAFARSVSTEAPKRAEISRK